MRKAIIIIILFAFIDHSHSITNIPENNDTMNVYSHITNDTSEYTSFTDIETYDNYNNIDSNAILTSSFDPNKITGGIDVLILNNNSGMDRLRDELLEYGDFNRIDFVSWYEQPDAELLENYDAVLVITQYINNALYLQAPLWGDIIAEYAEEGGGVVLGYAFFSNAARTRISGGLDYGKLDNSNYAPFKYGSHSYGSPRYLKKVLIPNHPIMEGVSSLESSYFYRGGANPGAVMVAESDDAGEYFAGYRDVGNGRIVGIQGHYFTNPHFINEGDFMQLYRNAILYSVPPIPSIETFLTITPQTLNCSSRGKWVKAHFVLPEEYWIEDVDIETPVTIDSLPITSDHIDVFYNNEDLVEVEVAFSRSDFCEAGLVGDVELNVRGWFVDGTVFYGTDSIRIMVSMTADRP